MAHYEPPHQDLCCLQIQLFSSLVVKELTLKAPIMTAADDIHKYFFIFFSEKIRLDVSSESSARQRIHMKNQALFPSKVKSKKLKCPLLQFLFGALRVKGIILLTYCKRNKKSIQ